MRLPVEAELSREQREVCQAPLEGATLVAGPPGSGKTVVAIFRRQAAGKLDVPADMAVYNRVLRQYTRLNTTFDGWLTQWWRTCTGRSLPRIQTAGSTYRPPDFKVLLRSAFGPCRDAVRRDGNWGHLVLDEAQDFNRDAHDFLHLVSNEVFSDLEPHERPSVTVLADDNQRMNSEANATLEDIADAHAVLNDDMYSLRRNYRNTREIARVAAGFYVGAPTGVPELPERRGDKPRLVRTGAIDDAVSRIANHALAHPEQEIGVLVQYTRTRKQLYNKLRHRLKGAIRVQQYGSGTANDEELVFDEPGTLTVLCFASAKGLEFDSVFLPELQTLRIDGANEDFAKMALYVMCSRARSQLTLMVDRQASSNDPLWTILPSEPNLRELFDVEG